MNYRYKNTRRMLCMNTPTISSAAFSQWQTPVFAVPTSERVPFPFILGTVISQVSVHVDIADWHCFSARLTLYTSPVHQRSKYKLKNCLVKKIPRWAGSMGFPTDSSTAFSQCQEDLYRPASMFN